MSPIRRMAGLTTQSSHRLLPPTAFNLRSEQRRSAWEKVKAAMNQRNRLWAGLTWPMLLLVASCHGEASNAGPCPGCGTGGSPNLGTGGSGASDAATVDSCNLSIANLQIWPDLWLDGCTASVVAPLGPPDIVNLLVDCVFVPYAWADAGVDGWLYDYSSMALTLTGQICDTFKAKSMARLHVIQGAGNGVVYYSSGTFLIHYVGADAE